MTLPLAGIRVLEVAGGAAAAYCGRLLVDAGAHVERIARSVAERDRGVLRCADAVEAAYAGYVNAGKHDGGIVADDQALQAPCGLVDIVIIGEDSTFEPTRAHPRTATVALSWFGQSGEFSGWVGSDLVVQALSGLPHMVGPRDGPPLQFGDRQSTVVGGITAYIAATAALMAPPSTTPRRFDVSILEANMVLSEMHMHFFERDGVRMARHGLNRFAPNGPVGIYACREGWIGITCTTPQQWQSLCIALAMKDLEADTGLMTRELRFVRLDEVEATITRALATRSAFEWAAVGREYKIPIVVVPDAAGILSHPIFKQRGALARFAHGDADLHVPRTPFALTGTSIGERLDPPTSPSVDFANEAAASDAHGLPLAGLRIVDFTMGWAGPLAGRLMADLGAEIVKIEAGRYPDWWRGVHWTPEYIANRSYEDAKGFLALNRGKQGTSIDLTMPAGRELALALIAEADAVIENQAAGVMAKMGLGYDRLLAVNPSLVMMSMSAFGSGNDWSDTRAYGSTLEQGSGLPSFVGTPGTPTMLHLAYGDPVGGLFGCAATLTALVHRKRSGQGQFVNLSMIESMLQFTTPALLGYQVTGAEPERRGNKHPIHVPHGIYASDGDDRWVAVHLTDDGTFARLAALIGRDDWAGDSAWATAAQRRLHEDELDAAISAWTRQRTPEAAATELQAAGIGAAPLVHADELAHVAHFEQSGFYLDLQREFSGAQRQCGVAIRQDGHRLGSLQPAPLLGEHSWAVFSRRLQMSREAFDVLVRDQVVTFAPTSIRNVSASPRNS